MSIVKELKEKDCIFTTNHTVTRPFTRPMEVNYMIGVDQVSLTTVYIAE